MALEVVMPEDYLGSVMGDVTSRRGNVKGMNPRNDVPGFRSGCSFVRDVWICN